ncbi:MAG: hypothetical protein AAFX76_03850 [Planctomycetota bacterium]
MQSVSRQVFQAILSNGYEVKVDRHHDGQGTRLLLFSRLHDEEAFYYFNPETEAQVVETIASQYCSAGQIERIYDTVAEALPRVADALELA